MDKKIIVIMLILSVVLISGCTFKTESDQTFGQKPNATLQDLYIVNSTGDHYDRNNTTFYFVWGYVGNKAGNPASDVEITAKFYDASGKFVGTNTTTPYRPKIIPPEGQAYYYISFNDPHKIITKYELSLSIKK